MLQSASDFQISMHGVFHFFVTWEFYPFAYHLSVAVAQVYPSDPDFSPELYTPISNCLMLQPRCPANTLNPL